MLPEIGWREVGSHSTSAPFNSTIRPTGTGTQGHPLPAPHAPSSVLDPDPFHVVPVFEPHYEHDSGAEVECVTTWDLQPGGAWGFSCLPTAEARSKGVHTSLAFSPLQSPSTV